MGREVVLKILLDSDKDEFGIWMDTKGFDEKTPMQNSLLIASILKIASDQELDLMKKN